jgi:hypothetical protein
LLKYDHNAYFFAENRQKSPKIPIITSTPGRRTFSDKEYEIDFLGSDDPAEIPFRFCRTSRQDAAEGQFSQK